MDNLKQRRMEQLIRMTLEKRDPDSLAPIDSSTNKEILKEIISRDEFYQCPKDELNLAIIANLPTVPKETNLDIHNKMVNLARNVLGDIGGRNEFIAFDLSKTAKIFHLAIKQIHDPNSFDIAKETFYAIYIRSHCELFRTEDIYLLIRHLVPNKCTACFYDKAQIFLKEIINF